ncbi:AraC family transcriptional regulator [Chitinophaga caeni]|uniref:AraC family transcriptional regulator n=1 Tax=Chitinophaga caeni TaxID=2029983 RepID=A0A291QQ59_9BACT|nr:helix-turn-helix domain-containing protein [Chitinophaga caeni]ATL46067.1 AraC family transcriptional regulator [Chitinophaga caeni]
MKYPKIYHREYEVPENTRDAINCIWYSKILFTKQLTSYEIIPDGYTEITFHFGEPCYVSIDGTLQPLPSPSMMGLFNKPVHLHSENQLEVLGIRCFPWTVFDLLDIPSTKKSIHIFEHPLAKLQDELSMFVEAGNITAAVHLLTRYFAKARENVAIDSLLSKAGIAMRAANGNMPVNQVASKAHATVRTLERKFKKSSGYTVKDVSSLMRFEKVRNELWSHPDANIAGLAIDAGYTDQAHLSREFKRFSGTTPAVFAREALKRQEVTDRDFVAFVQS